MKLQSHHKKLLLALLKEIEEQYLVSGCEDFDLTTIDLITPEEVDQLKKECLFYLEDYYEEPIEFSSPETNMLRGSELVSYLISFLEGKECLEKEEQAEPTAQKTADNSWIDTALASVTCEASIKIGKTNNEIEIQFATLPSEQVIDSLLHLYNKTGWSVSIHNTVVFVIVNPLVDRDAVKKAIGCMLDSHGISYRVD